MLFGKKEELSTDSCCNTGEPWQCCFECKEPGTKGHGLPDSTGMESPGKANPWRWKGDEWLPRLGGGRQWGVATADGDKTPFGVMKMF